MREIEKLIEQFQAGQMNEQDFCSKAIPLLLEQANETAAEIDRISGVLREHQEQIDGLHSEYHGVENMAAVLCDFIVSSGLQDDLDAFITQNYAYSITN